ncbi:MAG TPA: serine hydrolase [Bacillota bacterium]|nr:serine hydrolase [Bacillota bacterium]
MKKHIVFLCLFTFLLTTVTMTFAQESPSLKDYLNNPDYPLDYWRTDTPEHVGLDASVLNQAPVYIDSIKAEVHSMLVIKDGKLVFEHYGWDNSPQRPHQILPNEFHPMHSTTKSVTSALVGIAIQEGFIKSVKEPVLGYFKGYKPDEPSPMKSRITIEDVLTMRSGLKWNDDRDEWGLWNDSKPAFYVLDQPMVAEPGTLWNYSTGNSHILTSILYRTIGKTPFKYGKEKLFTPLGITNLRWDYAQDGVNHGGTALYLTPRDMAKFGYLYLNQGVWEGKQVVPKDWVENSLKSHTTTPWGANYGYHWWIRGNDCFATAGAFGQDIYVFPKEKTIVVFTANLPIETAQSTLERIAREYVIGAIKK